MFTRPPYLLVLALFVGICAALWIGITGPDLGWASVHPPSYAAHVIAQAPLFMPEACDEHGRTLNENRSWRLLVHDPAGRFWLERLSRSAQGPARVYVILGLQRVAPELSRQLEARWRTDTTTIQILRSLQESVTRTSVGAATAHPTRHGSWIEA